jgi:hypothetical protein
MNHLKSVFSQTFGLSLDPLLDTDQELVSFGGSADEALLFGSRIALQNPLLVQGHIQQFQTSTPQGYFLSGFWGHGANSYAFYYQVVDAWQRIFFRLPYGGVYMNEKKCARDIRNFLKQYIALQSKLKSSLKSWIAIESMGEGYYKAVLNNGETIELNESLLRCDNIRERFSIFITQEDGK